MKRTGLGPVLTVLLSGGVLALAGVLALVIFLTQPEPERERAVKKTPMLVEVVTAERGSFAPEIVATGRVRAAEDAVLAAQISGRVLERSPAFEPGAFVSAGEVLLRIEDAEARAALAQAEAALAQAEAQLALERGSQEVARLEAAQAARSLSEEEADLVGRGPQLRAAEAAVKSARAAVDRARLDLSRTRLRAPFDGQILRRSVSVGSLVGSGDVVGRILGQAAYQVDLALPVAMVDRVALPGEDGASGTPVTLRDRAAWGPDQTREGRVLSVLGQLDEQTRMARVLVEVADPFAQGEAAGGPALMAGAWVEGRLLGRPLDDVVRLPRELVRRDDSTWVMAPDDTLDIRSLELVFTDETWAYAAGGLEGGERIVVTNLSKVSQGAPLRLGDAAP